MIRFVVLFLSLLASPLIGQRLGVSTLLSLNDGLSQGMIFDIRQSRDGFMWIATKDGLNRYDGYRFTVYTNDPFDPFSIASNEVWKIFEDSRGWLWLACPGGLDVLTPSSERFFHILPDLEGYNGDSVTFTETPDGTIWMTVTGKCWKIVVPPKCLEQAVATGNASPDLPVVLIERQGTLFSSIFFTGDERLLVGSTQGVFEVDPTTGTLHEKALSGISVGIVGEDDQGRIWLVELAPNLEGLFHHAKYDMWLWEPAFEPPQPIACLPYGRFRFDHQGNLWAWKTTDNIFRRWTPDKFLSGAAPDQTWVNDQSFSQNASYFPTTIAFDRSGNSWVGTNGFGAVKINFQYPGFNSYLPLTSQRMITEGPDGSFYLQEDHFQQYSSYDFQHGHPSAWAIPKSISEKITVIGFDGQGNCWANKDADVLYRIGTSLQSGKPYLWQARGLLASRSGMLLGVREEGLQVFDPNTTYSRLVPFDRQQSWPTDFRYSHFLYEDPTGTVWIFAFKGLIEARPAGDGYDYQYYENNTADRTSLSNNTILSVAADPLEPARYLWVGTKGGGLNRLDRETGNFRHYKTEQGLPDNVIYGILPDDRGHLWLSTNRGLCRFHTREETVRNFTVADGLQSNEFNQSSYLRTHDGHLIFGGVNGLTVFHPDSLRFNERRPAMAITQVWVNNQSASFRINDGLQELPLLLSRNEEQALELHLTHRQNLISLEFAALEFSNSARNQYRYQLIRQKTLGKTETEAWVDLGYDNRVQFANLRPGRYTFQVLGSNNDGAWSEQPAVLAFTIAPPWWATWWALLLYFLLTGASLYLLYRYQLRQRLQLQEAERLKELDQFKNRFFTNITHEFRTPLTVILGVTNQLRKKDSALTQGESPHKLDLIRRNGENLLRLINQLLDLAKLESDELRINYVLGDVLPYLRYIAESLHSLANVRNVMLQVRSDHAPIMMDYDPERLQQIVYNLLSNAIKFTPTGGQVMLEAKAATDEQRARHLILRVSDTGVGIPASDLSRIFDRFQQADHLAKAHTGGTGIGLALTRELVHAMGGEISVESKLGEGTIFQVVLPIHRRAPMAALGETDPINEAKEYLQELAASPANAKDGRPQLLIMEDNPDVVEYLSSCLHDTYELTFAYNGRIGIETALEQVPDLIISDVMMPEKDGFEVCDTLKNDERSSHIPIVLLTARAGVEDRIAGLRRGADAYLAKPFHEEELRVTLENLFDLRRRLQQKYQDTVFEITTAPTTTASAADPESEFLVRARSAVIEHLSDASFTVGDLCQELAMSQPQLHRKLTALTGKNATLFIRSLRLAKAREMLQAGGKNVSEVAYEVGFSDPKYFSRVFTEEFGLPPSKINA